MIKEIIAEAIVKLAGIKLSYLKKGRELLVNEMDIESNCFEVCWDALYNECEKLHEIIRKHQIIYIPKRG
jgi:hypothetical protein